MAELTTPRASDWDNFWVDQKAGKIAQASWSKRRIISLIEPFAVSGKKALDAGSGSGFFAKYFCDRGMKTTALDYSDAALKMTKGMTQDRANVIKGDLLSSALPQNIPERFDLIFSDGLLEHFPKEEQDKIIKNFIALLSNDGVLITFVPNRWSPWELIRPFFMPGIEETPFVLSDLLDLNARNGLRVLSEGGINTLPFAFSPDKIMGSTFGMLLYTIARKNVK